MTGIENLRDYAKSLKDKYPYDKVRIEAIADRIERETMPRPLFEDGEPVQFGDEFPGYGSSIIVDFITFYRNGDFSLSDAFGRDWLFDAGDRVKRHAPKVLDADGMPINIDDTVWDVRGLGPYTVHSFEKGGSSVYVDEPERCGITVQHMVKPEMLTHKKPEPPDSWEKIEADMLKDKCEYFGRGKCRCFGCKVATTDRPCEEDKASDIVRRCRALAEKKSGRCATTAKSASTAIHARTLMPSGKEIPSSTPIAAGATSRRKSDDMEMTTVEVNRDAASALAGIQ